MSNFYCHGCRVVLCSKSDYGVIDGKEYCAECYDKKIQEALGAPAPADVSNSKEH